jgi:hypothetical protein
MSHTLNAGIQVQGSDGVWYSLTDDNRQPIKIAYEVIEKTSRMADGTLRRYVIARKHKITASWQNVWSHSTMSSDNGKAGAWMKSFYEANVFIPINVRLTVASVNTQNISTTSGFVPTETVAVKNVYSSGDTYIPSFVANQSGNMVYNVFITQFDYEVVKRNKDFDLVNISIEFTEI